MQLFYAAQIEGNLAQLSAEEAQHAVRVLRKRVGDELWVMDGLGGIYSGTIVETGRDTCTVEVTLTKQEQHRAPNRLHLAVAPTKNIDRFEWLLEKATEIGVDRITPLLCTHSERKRIRTDRLQKILLAATKQSLQSFIPVLDDLTSFADFLKQELPPQRRIAWCGEVLPLHLQDTLTIAEDVCILIGPEGDFSAEEVAQAQAHDFLPVSLGPTRLRTETAGIVAVHTVALHKKNP